ncbi:hypothetical protein ABTN64_19165, partial [Acinetobacter baumannii]
MNGDEMLENDATTGGVLMNGHDDLREKVRGTAGGAHPLCSSVGRDQGLLVFVGCVVALAILSEEVGKRGVFACVGLIAHDRLIAIEGRHAQRLGQPAGLGQEA